MDCVRGPAKCKRDGSQTEHKTWLLSAKMQTHSHMLILKLTPSLFITSCGNNTQCTNFIQQILKRGSYELKQNLGHCQKNGTKRQISKTTESDCVCVNVDYSRLLKMEKGQI